MASGDTLLIFTPSAASFPASAAPQIDTRNNHLVLDYDDTAQETAYFAGVMPRHYGGGGVTIQLVWMAETATTGNVEWETAFERHEDDVGDLDSDSFATAQASGAVACASVSGEAKYTATNTHTAGAQLDSVVAGESFRLSVARDADDGTNDTMSDDAELMRVSIKET